MIEKSRLTIPSLLANSWKSFAATAPLQQNTQNDYITSAERFNNINYSG